MLKLCTAVFYTQRSCYHGSNCFISRRLETLIKCELAHFLLIALQQQLSLVQPVQPNDPVSACLIQKVTMRGRLKRSSEEEERRET